MGGEHLLTTEQVADYSRRQLIAFDKLPKAAQDFMRRSDISLDAEKALDFVNRYGASAFIQAASAFVKEYQKKRPICA